MKQRINFNGKSSNKKAEGASSGGYRKKETSGVGRYVSKEAGSSEGYARKPQGESSRYGDKEATSGEGYVRKTQGSIGRYANKDSASEGSAKDTHGKVNRHSKKYAPKKEYVPKKEYSGRREIIKDERFASDQEAKKEKYISDEPVKNERFLKTDSNNKELENEIREDLVEGRNAVIEVLKSTKTVEQILISKGDTEGSISVVLALAKERGIVVKEVDRKKLDSMSYTGVHQGVIAIVTPYNYFEVQDILNLAKERGEKPFIIVVDEIEDPHNLGSLIRTAEIVGAHGLIIPKRRNVGITPIVYKSSAGATSHMRIAKVSNINMAIKELKKNGVWIYGADMDGKDYCYNADLSGAVALVIGSEGKGISKLTKEKCDVLVKIPMVGKINSYNASVAGGILMYEVLKQKLQK